MKIHQFLNKERSQMSRMPSKYMPHKKQYMQRKKDLIESVSWHKTEALWEWVLGCES